MATLKITAKNPEESRHTSDVQTLLFHNGKLFSGAEDGKIKIWQKDLKYVGEIQAHNNCVYSLAAIGNTLYSCANDGKVKAWDIPTLKTVCVLHSGDTDVIKLYADKTKLYAGDEHGFIGVYENNVMTNHLNVVEEVKDLIATGNIMYTVRHLDVTVTEILSGNTGKFAIRNSFEGRAPLALVADRFAVCTRDGKNVLVYKIKEDGHLQMFCTITGSDLIIQSIAGIHIGGQAILYSGGWDKIIKRWIVSGDKPLPGGCAIVPTVINTICCGAEGQAYVGGTSGLICRLDAS